MIRQGLASNAKNVFVSVTRSSGARLTARSATGGATDSTATAGAAPQWLRLTRSGSRFTASRSTDGTHWTVVGTRSVSMSGTVLIGLAVTAHNNAALNASTFDNVRITRPAKLTTGSTVPITNAPAPTAAFQQTDIETERDAVERVS